MRVAAPLHISPRFQGLMNRRFRCPVAFVLALPLLSQAADVPEQPLPAGIAVVPLSLPADVDLQRRGARIGRVVIQVDEVFEEASPLPAPYRLVNGLHVSTQKETVQRQLLFQSGDPYDPRVLAETERLLRSQRYLNEAVIQPVGYRDNRVDVLVRVHDVWTLNPGISFGRKGGENSTRFRFEDANFLGRGQFASVARSRDVDRTAWRIGYRDPNLFGSWWQMSGAYASSSDGAERALDLRQPFYSLDAPWSAGLELSDTTSAVSRYERGHVLERLDMDEQSIGIDGGISAGLEAGWTRRYLGGVRSLSRCFSHRSEYPDAVLPAARDLVYPWFGFEAIEDDYVLTRNLDQIGRTEDLHVGRRARLEVGLASSAFGSTRDAVILGGAVQAGAELGDEQFWINSLDATGRLDSGEIVDGRLALGSRYYYRHSMHRVSFASLTATLTRKLDAEEQLLLGGDNGLRGFPLRYQSGTASALITMEERYYSNWQPLKLFNVGAALFLDAGRTWGRSEPAAASDGWLADVGLGLRLGSARSGLGNVLHVDVAVPLNGPSGIDAVQLLIETRTSF